MKLLTMILALGMFIAMPALAEDISREFNFQNYTDARRSDNNVEIDTSVQTGDRSKDIDGYFKVFSVSFSANEREIKNLMVKLEASSIDANDSARSTFLQDMLTTDSAQIEISVPGPIRLNGRDVNTDVMVKIGSVSKQVRGKIEADLERGLREIELEVHLNLSDFGITEADRTMDDLVLRDRIELDIDLEL